MYILRPAYVEARSNETREGASVLIRQCQSKRNSLGPQTDFSLLSRALSAQPFGFTAVL